MWFAAILSALTAQAPQGSPLPNSLPPAFIANEGQWNDEIRFACRQGGADWYVTETGLTLRAEVGQGSSVSRPTIELRWPADLADGPRGADPTTSRHHYFFGQDPAGWVTDVNSFSTIVVPATGSIEVAPTGDGVRLRVPIEPGKPFRLLLTPPEERVVDAAELVASYPEGRLRLSGSDLDLAWSSDGGITASPRPNSVGSTDVHIVFSALIGGGDQDRFRNSAVADDGTVVLTGYTESLDYPVTPSSLPPAGGGQNVVVARIDPSIPALLYSVMVGAQKDELGSAVDLDAAGRAVVTGFTWSPLFPVTPGAFDAASSASLFHHDAFVFKLQPDGGGFVYSTFLGGSSENDGDDVVVAPDGEAVVVGSTKSIDFPTTPRAFQEEPPVFSDSRDGFVVRLSADGTSAAYSTYLGGLESDVAASVTLAPNGEPVVSGWTQSKESFPVTPGAYNTAAGGIGDAGFVTRFASDGSRLVYSTFFDGLGSGRPNGIGLDAQEAVTIAGWTVSPSLPTTPGAIQPKQPGNVYDGFVLRLSPGGDALLAGTYLGAENGQITDRVYDLSVSPSGVATVVGVATTGFPTTPGAWKSGITGDGYLARISPSATRLLYSTFFGGDAGAETLTTVRDYTPGLFLLAGSTGSEDFPTTVDPGPDPIPGNAGQAFVTIFDPSALGVARYGAATPSCLGDVELGLSPYPSASEPDVVLFAGGAPPHAPGFVVVGFVPDHAGLPVSGVALHVAPVPPWILLPAQADADGYAEIAHPVPAGLVGTSVYEQAFWIDPGTCGAAGALSASQGLAVTLQP